MNKRLFLTVVAFMCLSLAGWARKGFDRGIKTTTFVPKGMYTGGVSLSYVKFDAKDYDFLILDGIDAKAFNFKISPHLAYAIKDDMAIGVRFGYMRTYANIGNVDISLGDDLSFKMDHYRVERNSYKSAVFLRTYMSLFGSKVVGFYNDLQLSYSYSRSKILNHEGRNLTGTFEIGHTLRLGARPGLAVFVQDNVAVDVSIDVMGASMTWNHQTRDRIETGKMSTASANFTLNLLSVNIGVATYF